MKEKKKQKAKEMDREKVWQSNERKTRKKNIEGAIFTEKFLWFLMTQIHKM